MSPSSRLQPPGWRPLWGPLGRRLLGWLLVFSLVPLFLSNSFGYWKSKDILSELTRRYVDALAQVEAKHIRSQVERYLLDLEAIAAGNEFLSAGALRISGAAVGPMGVVADEEAITRHLQRKLAELSAFHVLYLQSPGGALLASTGPVPAEALQSNGMPKPSQVFEGLAQVGRDGPPLFRLLAPVRGSERDGEPVVAYLGGLIGREGLGTFLEIPEHLAGSVESFIVDGQGMPLFVSHEHGHLDYRKPLVSPALEADSGTFVRYVNREGVEVIATSVGVDDLPWRYLAEAPVTAALGPLRQLRSTSLWVEAGMAVGLVILAWLVAGGMVAPIGRLVAATRRVGRGDLGVRVDPAGASEIGELGRAFNEMTRELADSRERVEELHRREMARAGQLATVGELASGVAHEIKNPLVGISNGMDLVRRRIGDDPALSPIMEEMDRQLERIGDAVRDLLAFARPAQPSLAPTDPDHVARRAVRLVAPAAESRGVRIATDLQGEGDPASLDEELVRQALVNLLMNAVHATEEGGSVVLSTRSDGTWVRIAVRDEGRGIKPGDRGQIFKPFFTTRHSGTGLGLSITKEIVERHGGRIEVSTTVGEGSMFTLVLPLVGPPGGEAGGDVGSPVASATGREDVRPGAAGPRPSPPSGRTR